MASVGAASKQCAPFPPGLEPEAAEPAANKMLDEAAKEMRAAAMESIEKQLQQIGDGENRESIIAAVRKVVLDEVDERVKDKAEELWLKGKNLLSSVQSKHKDKTHALADNLAECLRKQQILEEENAKLKQALNGLASRFQLLGAAFNAAPKMGLRPGGMGAGDASTAASTMSPNQTSVASELFTPQAFTPGPDLGKGADAAEPAKFPAVPEFPFQEQTPVAQLSLAEALQQSPQQLSLASSLAPGGSDSTGDFTAAAGQENSTGTYSFSFTLRKADGADLGLNVSHHEHDRILRVEGIRAEGAVEAWNRQCASSSFADKTVLAGDTITSVNNIMLDPKKMLEECRDKQLLKLTIVRPRVHAKSSATLRADAAEFVPGAGLLPQAPAEDSKEASEEKSSPAAVESVPEADKQA